MNLNCEVTVTAVTTLREKEGDSLGPIRKALTIKASVDVAKVLGLFVTESAREKFTARYWDEDSELILPSLEDTCALEAEMIGGKCIISAAGGFSEPLSFDSCDLKKIKLIPQDGEIVALSASLQVNPQGDQYRLLDNMLQTEVRIDVMRALADSEKESPQGRLSLPLPQGGGADDGSLTASNAAAGASGEASDDPEGTPPVENVLPGLDEMMDTPTPKAAELPPGVVVPGQKPPQRPRKEHPSAKGTAPETVQ